MTEKQYLVGAFNVTSGRIIVRDPCHALDLGNIITAKAKKGEWLMRVYQSNEGWLGMRNANWRAY